MLSELEQNPSYKALTIRPTIIHYYFALIPPVKLILLVLITYDFKKIYLPFTTALIGLCEDFMPTNSPDDQKPSKTQVKKAMADLQKLGEQLVKLPETQLAKIPLPSHLQEQIYLARTLTAHGAVRRQLQYIGKLMRDVDIAPIQAELQKLQQTHLASTLLFQQAEQWREQMLAQGDAPLAKFIDTYPSLDKQLLRQYLRLALADHKQQKDTGASKKLFKYIMEILKNAS